MNTIKSIFDLDAIWANHPDIIIAMVLVLIALVALELRQLSEERKKTNARCRAIRYRHLKR